MREIRGEVDSRWSEYHCFKYDEATGRRSLGPTSSRVRGLTNLITRGDPTALRPGEVDAIPEAERAAWALGEIAREVEAELERLHAHRATLDHARFDANRAEAGRRAIQTDDKATALARKYENAAALAFDRTLKQLAAYRREQRRSPAEERTAARSATDHDCAAEARERRDAPEPLATGPGLGSFVPAPERAFGPIDAAEFAIGRAPTTSFAAPRPPRYTP